MTSEKKGQPQSDRPLPELKKEREAFIETFFRKGAQLTEELLSESVRLRHRLAELEADNANLRAQVASDDAIRDLLKKIELLEREKGDLMSRYREAEAVSTRYVDQYSEVESELANLANLYVASYQLHSSLSLRMTVRQIKELLEQLVGARAYALYLGSEDGKSLVPIVSTGVGVADLSPVSAIEGPVGMIFGSGLTHIETGSLAGGSVKNPVAVVPLKVEERSVGVLAVFATLEQKSRFLPVDFELFKLLGAHAGVALVCARLYAETGKQIPGLDGFLDLKL